MWPLPAVMATAPVRPDTVTGVVELVVVPSPSCPKSLPPQQRAVPSASSAHVCIHPAVMATAPVRPDTTTGVVELVAVPSPSCPESLPPQHLAVPSASSPQVWSQPAVIRCCGLMVAGAKGSSMVPLAMVSVSPRPPSWRVRVAVSPPLLMTAPVVPSNANGSQVPEMSFRMASMWLVKESCTATVSPGVTSVICRWIAPEGNNMPAGAGGSAPLSAGSMVTVNPSGTTAVIV